MGAVMSEKAETVWRPALPLDAIAPKANGAGTSRAVDNR
jgi:hypothetical protein